MTIQPMMEFAPTSEGDVPFLSPEEYQLGDAGVLLNGDDAALPFVDILRVQGLDNADIRLTTHDHEGTDGGYIDSEFETIRTIVLEGKVYADVFNMESYLDALKANYAPSRTNIPFYFGTDAGIRMVMCKPQGVRYDKDQLRRIGSCDVQFTVMCEDPRIYSPTLVTDSSSLEGGEVEGRGYPKAYTFGYGSVATENSLILELDGNRPTPAVLEIKGPVVNPRVVYDGTGTEFEFQITLAPDTVLTIDLATKSVRLGNANRRYTMTLLGPWPLLTPGLNTFRFFGSGFGPETQLTVSAYAAWR